VDEETREAKHRKELRELVRLLYVTLTRSRTALVIPWAENADLEKDCFAGIWDLDPRELDPLPEHPGRVLAPARRPAGGQPAPDAPASVATISVPEMPRRILPHELSAAPDPARAALHESGLEAPQPARAGPDPLEYGVWWHEALEGLPWSGDNLAVEAHGARALSKAAELGFEDRGRQEWERFLASEPCRLIREPRWARLAEAGILAPYRAGEWIDGVIDLVLHDPAAGEVWIVDWKTNRRDGAEDDAGLAGRLASLYQPQLAAYGGCAAAFFPGCRIRLWVYSTVAGIWAPVESPA
jgi:ATP-dependent exoDNAse (exonuclease V) beta subunit